MAQSGREAGVRIGEAEETRALALANLAWSIRRARTRDVLSEARDLYRQAHLAVPDNPYHFAGFLECEALERRSVGFVDLLLSQVDAAVERCEEHARVGIELPYAYFTIARLHLLAGRTHQGLLAFAKAIHRSSSEYPIEQELASILDLQDLLISPGSATQNGLEMARKLLVLGKAAKLLLRDAESGALEELDALFCEAQAGEGDGVRTLMRRHALNVPRPFVIVAGGADPSLEDRWSQYEPMLRDALADFEGSLFSGGTRTGIPGMLGKIAGTSRAAGAKTRCLIGYIPRRLPVDGLLDQRYHEHVVTDGDRFSQLEPLQNWIDILGAGVCPRDVRVLGINGGEIAKFEYYLGLALGATVGLVESSGRSASLLLEEDPWWEETQLLRLPEDAMTIRAFLAVEPGSWGQQDPGIQMPNLEKAARRIHENHQRSSLEDWDSLREDFRRSNLHQAAYSVNILQAAGLKIRRKAKARIEVLDLEKAIGRRRLRELATMEHGRWNVERLLQGWSYGAEKDEEGRLSPYLVPWKELSREIQQYDIDAVANFPQVLREAGLEVYG